MNLNTAIPADHASPLRGVEIVRENLPWFDKENHYETFDEATQMNLENAVTAVTSIRRKPLDKPLEVLLSRSVYPLEDGYIEAIVRLKAAQEAAPSGSLEIWLSDGAGKEIGRETISPIGGDQLFFSFAFPPELENATGSLHVRWNQGEGGGATETKSFTVARATGVQREGRVPLRIENALKVKARGVPVSVGVPFPLGALAATEHLRLVDATGRDIALQVKETARWARFGSLRWVLCDFVVDLDGGPRELFLEYGPAVRRKEVEPLKVAPVASGGFPRLDAGRLRFDEAGIHLGTSGPLVGAEALQGAYVERVDGMQFRGWGHHYVLSDHGKYQMDRSAKVEVEQAGSQKIVLRTSGDYRENGTGDPFCRYVVRYVIYRDSPIVRIFHTWIYTGNGDRDAIHSMGWRFPFGDDLKPVGFLSGFGSDARWLDDYYLRQEDHENFAHFAYKAPAGKDRRITEGQAVEPSRPLSEAGKGRRAPGVMAAGGREGSLLFGVKDFWQNFPSSLMLEKDAMTFHQWPKYGAPRRHTFGEATLGDTWHLWFAHEGENLSFRLPTEFTEGAIYASESGVEPHFAYGRPDSVNAQGIAKTAEMWLAFQDESQPGEASIRLMEALNSEALRAVVDPRWMMASGAFYEMHPRDPEHFPEEEKIYELNALKPIRQVEQMGVYGKWIYGDLLRSADLDEKTASLYRTFRKAHWGWPYSWIPFARSGDLRFYKFAEAATRMMTDVAFCHYVDDEMRAHFASLPPRLMWSAHQPFREIGWHNRNLIPWAGYWGPSSRLYVDKVDYLWHAWYLTGYDRARDVALAWAGQTKVEQPGHVGRGPITAAGNRTRWPINLQKQYLEMYLATFDPWFLAGTHAIAEMNRHRFLTEGWGGHPWNTGPNDFQRYTGDPAHGEFFTHAVERLNDWQSLGWARTFSTLFPSAALGWKLHHDPYLLRRIAGMLEATRWQTYTAEEPAPHRGYIVLGTGEQDMLFTSFYQQWFPYLLTPIAKAGKWPENPIPPAFSQTVGNGSRILLEKKEGEPLAFRLPAPFRVNGPDGSVALEVKETEPKADRTVAASAPEGTYTIRFEKPHSVELPISPPGTAEVLVPAEGTPVASATGIVQYCFLVPKGVKSFEVTFHHTPPQRQAARQVTIWNPEGKESWVYREMAKGGSHPGKVVVATVEVPPAMEGRIWRLTQPALSSMPFTLDPAIPPVLAHSPDRWFAPSER
ncbi:MAG TPA: hypothetical protein VNQ90_01490 [Chthoniobacteraceae bacterium]|nr:hypothetical protein [Chthoniobacteraceae bacterium]